MTWVKNSRGDYANIGSAVSGEIINSPRAGKLVRLKDERGNEVTVVSEDALTPAATVIGGPIPSVFINSQGECQWRCVAAWRVGRNGAEPILVGSRPAGMMCVAFADGSLLGVDCGRRFADLEAAVDAAVGAAAQEEELVQ